MSTKSATKVAPLADRVVVKPLEEAYRDRNQTCRLRIESQRGALHLAPSQRTR